LSAKRKGGPLSAGGRGPRLQKSGSAARLVGPRLEAVPPSHCLRISSRLRNNPCNIGLMRVPLEVVSALCPQTEAEKGVSMDESEFTAVAEKRFRARSKRPRSAVTSGRAMFVNGDPNSAWARRFHDLASAHAVDLGGADRLSSSQLSLIRRCAAIQCELERMEARLSRGESVDLDVFTRTASHLRRIFETLGIERKPRNVTPKLADYLSEAAE
jgi:hypothetical protein